MPHIKLTIVTSFFEILLVYKLGILQTRFDQMGHPFTLNDVTAENRNQKPGLYCTFLDVNINLRKDYTEERERKKQKKLQSDFNLNRRERVYTQFRKFEADTHRNKFLM